MAFSLEKASSDVFNTVSSKIRLQVLRILNSRGPMPYTEIMFSLKLDPVRDAGKFIYHLARSLKDLKLKVYFKNYLQEATLH